MKEYKRQIKEAEEVTYKEGDLVILGKKRPRSIWRGKMKSGAKMIVLETTSMADDGDSVLVVAFEKEYNKAGFDPEMDYQIVYPDELKK